MDLSRVQPSILRDAMRIAGFLLLMAASGALMHSAGADPSPVIQEPEEVVLTLNAEGFVPAEVTRGPRRFLLSVDNRSGVEELTLILKASDGTQLREMSVARGGSDWSELLDLAPGSYTLTEASHSSWLCAFTIVPQSENRSQ